MVPEGRLHMRPFQFHLKEHWRYPQSLDNLLPWTEAIAAHLDWWQNPSNVMKGADLHPKDHSIQLFTDASNEGWGAHLDQNSTKGLWSDREKRLHINVLELKAVSLALRDFKDQCQNQTVLVATDNSTVVAYINKQGGTHSAEMCALLWKIMTWCHHYHITLKARHIPGCLNVMADLLSRSNQVQSTEWSLHPQVFKQICQKWFTPHVDLFATHLNHKLPLYVSPIPDRSEIHAWVANKVSNLGQWEKVALFPSSDFIAKNQLAREGSQSVSPVTIPALTTIVDRQFKEDRTLCPVRALRFYLDRTKDLRGSRSLLFISFKKGHTSDIRPATLSSWLKQTILLCYKQADQQALDLVQVKAHDIRAFAASKAFYGGVSVDQIMQACHWKAHNTFTNFYLKDLTWSDTDNNLYLGPVVAAQQVLDPSPQTSCPRKEKKGGGGGGAHPLQPSLQESFPGSRYSFTFKMLRVRSFYPLIIK